MDGHDVCSCPDGEGWLVSADKFFDYAEGQYQVQPEDRIFHIFSILISDLMLPGRCWCGAAWAGRDAKHRFRVHTAEGWFPLLDDNGDL